VKIQVAAICIQIIVKTVAFKEIGCISLKISVSHPLFRCSYYKFYYKRSGTLPSKFLVPTLGTPIAIPDIYLSYT
jgi:hypothetical protein